jgi:hypothetical protein
MFSTSGEEFSLTLSRVHSVGKPAEMFRTGGGIKLLWTERRLEERQRNGDFRERPVGR